MKKNYLLVGAFMLLLAFSAAGQQLVWENRFNNAADVEGWVFSDGNSNGNQWVQGQNIYYDGTSLVYGSEGVLRHSINLVPTGTATGFAAENDWIVSPEIDLTMASGTITLAAYVGRQRPTHTTVSRSLWIYVSTPAKPVPDLADFQAMTVDGNGNDVASPYFIGAGFTSSPWPSSLTEYVESLVDLSAFAGKKVYIAMWSNRKTSGGNAQNINIDEMAIYASELSSTVTGVSLNKTSLNLTEGSSETLLATVTPTDASNKEVQWSSSNEAVAIVDAAGKITALATGTTTITVTTAVGNKTAACTVNVIPGTDYSWLKAPTIAVDGSHAKVVGPDADKFTRFYIDNQAVDFSAGQADLTGKTGALILKATTEDASGVIRLKISK